MIRGWEKLRPWSILLILLFSYSASYAAPTPSDHIRIKLSNAFFEQKDLSLTKQLLDEMDYSSSIALEVLHHRFLSEYLLKTAHYKEAIKLIDEVIMLYPDFSSPDMAFLWGSSSSIDKMYGRVLDAIEKSEKSIALARKYGLKDLELEGLVLLGTAAVDQGKLIEGLSYFKTAREFPQTASNFPSHLALYNSIAGLYMKQRKYSIASKQLLQGLKIIENLPPDQKAQHISRQLFFQLNLSLCFEGINDIVNAEHYLNLALNHPQISRIQKNKAYFVQGLINSNKKDYPKALASFKEALRINAESKIPKQRIIFFNELCDVYLAQNKISLAKAYIDSSLQLLEKHPKLRRNAYIDVLQVEILLKENKYEAAAEMAAKNIAFQRSLEIPQFLSDSHQQLFEAHQKLGQYQKANVALDSLIVLQSEQNNLDNFIFTNEMEYEFRLDKKNKSINQLQLNNLALQKKIDRNKNMTLGLSILLFFLLALAGLGFLFSKNQKQFTLQQESITAQQMSNLKKQSELELLNANINGQEIERKKLSQQLNNQLGSQLATLQMELEHMQNKSPKLSASLEETQRLLDSACQEVRRISDNLMPGALANLGLTEALEDLKLSIEKNSIIKVHLSIFSLPKEMNQDLAIFLYRCTEELINNCIKHAQAMNLIIQLTQFEDELQLTIEDDGIGFNPIVNSKGIGLKNLQARVAQYNGQLKIESSLSKGSTFNISVPFLTLAKNDKEAAKI